MPLSQAAANAVHENKSPQSHLARYARIAVVIVVVWLAFGALPGVPFAPGVGLDASWVLGMNLAHTQGLVHGRDIVWTYGPLGYLSVPMGYGPVLYQVLVFKLGVYLLWCVALVRLALSAVDWFRAWIPVLIGIFAVVDPYGDHLHLAIFTWLLVVLADTPAWGNAGLFLIAFLAALECLMKVNLGVQSALLFTAVLVVVWRQHARASKTVQRRIVAAGCLFPLAVVTLYSLESGGPAGVAAYLRNSLEIAGGYGEGMSADGPVSQVAIALAGMAILFLLLPWLEKPARNLAAGYVPAAVYAFFAFKAAMVRQDAHAANFELQLALASLFLFAIARKRRFLYATAVFQIVCVFISYYYITASWPATNSTIASRLSVRGNFPGLDALLDWRQTWTKLERTGQQNLSALRADAGLRAIIGKRPVEVLPWEVARVAANDWTWRPRPIFQSYAAYTPRLDEMNASYLRSGRAADFAVLDWYSVDGRHPFLETPSSWRAQLDLYETVAMQSGMLVLGRRTGGHFRLVEPIRSETVSWERAIPVPQSTDPVIVAARIRKSAYGALRNLVFRSSPLYVSVTRQSGRNERYRALRANFADGVIMNQLPAALGDLALLATPGCSIADPVVSFRLETPAPAEFSSQISVEWSKLVRRPEEPPAAGCVIASAERQQFPAWGGTSPLVVTVGAGNPPAVRSSADWLHLNGSTTPGTMDLTLSANRNPGERKGEIFAAVATPVRQAGIAHEPVSTTIQLGTFRPDYSPPKPTHFQSGEHEVIADPWTTFGLPGDQAFMGDWTGDGRMRIGVFRAGWWYLDLNGNGRWDGVAGGDGMFPLGLPGDIGVVGDWTGDGVTKLGVFRKGDWYLDLQNLRRYYPTIAVFKYGLPGDLPAVGKWKPGSRLDQVGVFRRGKWYVDSNGDHVWQPTDDVYSFGLDGDIPVVSWSRSRLGVYRKGTWVLEVNGSHRFESNDAVVLYGAPGDRPLIGEW